MSYEDRARAVIQRVLWPNNPNSVSMASSALLMAAAMDRAPADVRQERAASLRHVLRHLADCQPDPANVLDPIVARYCKKRAENYAAWVDSMNQESESEHGKSD